MITVIERYLNSLSEDILILKIQYRDITILPDITRFKNLKELYCNDNKLSCLPTLPKSLEILHCGNNTLTCLPTLPQSLEILYCYNNKLTCLPTLPQSLELLNCYNNILTSFPTLPQKLKKIHCSNNKLTCLPILPENLQIFHYFNNPIYNILDNTNSNTLIKIKLNIKILNNFHHLYNCLQFKKQFTKWLWKSREKKIMEKYHPNYLLENLDENADLDKFLNDWY
jgi:hypothetical protein